MLKSIGFILGHPMNRGRPLRAMGRMLWWQAASRLASGPIVVDFIDATKLAVVRGMNGATGNIYYGLQEFEDMAFALHFLRPGDLFVDVGANVGMYSAVAAAAGADVIAFEPGERFADLTRNSALNGGSWQCIRAAVGEENGVLRFTSGLDCENRRAVGSEDAIEAPMVTLDGEVSRRPTLVKIDVEGAEVEVLRGGEKTLASADAVIIEITGEEDNVFGHTRQDVVGPLESWGFRHVGYDPLKRAIQAPTLRGNNIFVRASDADLNQRLQAAPRFRVGGRMI